MSRAAILPAQRTDWATPQALFDAVNRVFGFTLDVCATRANSKCDRFIAPPKDALSEQWAPHTCWCNPPFGKGLDRWIQKALDEAAIGTTTVMLLPYRPGTRWWRLARQGEVTEIEGRVTFEGAPNAAPFDCALVVFRPRLPARMRVPR